MWYSQVMYSQVIRCSPLQYGALHFILGAFLLWHFACSTVKPLHNTGCLLRRATKCAKDNEPAR